MSLHTNLSRAMAPAVALLSIFGRILDGVTVALCAFDQDDRALAWNRTFLKFFPEHAGHVCVGEPYSLNLRRFYQARLSPAELPLIDKYIDEGVARHRAQSIPFSFEHRGCQLTVSSLAVPSVGRVRIWKSEGLATGSALQTLTSAALSTDGPADLRLLFDSIADGVMITDAEGIVRWINQPCVAMYGLETNEGAIGLRFQEIYDAAWQSEPEQVRPVVPLSEKLRFAGAPFEISLPTGRWIRVMHQMDADKGAGVLTHVDITALKRQQEELTNAEHRASASRALLEAALERMEQGVMMVNADRIVEVCNRRAIELLDLPPELMASRPRFESVLEYQWSKNEFGRSPLDLQEFIRAGGILDRPQLYDRERPNGQVLEIHSVPIAGGGVLRTYTDITARKKDEERLRYVSRHDGLTTLVNREVFLEHLAGAVEMCGGSNEHFAVHYVDLDRFKPINDQFGHATGDKVLVAVAARMRRIARDSDVVGRMGGDEFAVLQRQVDHRNKSEGFAKRLLQELCDPLEIDGRAVEVGASIGIAHFPDDGRDAETLLCNADVAMYKAKSSGRDCVRIYGEARHP